MMTRFGSGGYNGLGGAEEPVRRGSVVPVVLELAFPETVLPVLLNIVGLTYLLVWTSALLAHLCAAPPCRPRARRVLES